MYKSNDSENTLESIQLFGIPNFVSNPSGIAFRKFSDRMSGTGFTLGYASKNYSLVPKGLIVVMSDNIKIGKGLYFLKPYLVSG